MLPSPGNEMLMSKVLEGKSVRPPLFSQEKWHGYLDQPKRVKQEMKEVNPNASVIKGC